MKFDKKFLAKLMDWLENIGRAVLIGFLVMLIVLMLAGQLSGVEGLLWVGYIFICASVGSLIRWVAPRV